MVWEWRKLITKDIHQDRSHVAIDINVTILVMETPIEKNTASVRIYLVL